MMPFIKWDVLRKKKIMDKFNHAIKLLGISIKLTQNKRIWILPGGMYFYYVSDRRKWFFHALGSKNNFGIEVFSRDEIKQLLNNQLQFIESFQLEIELRVSDKIKIENSMN